MKINKFKNNGEVFVPATITNAVGDMESGVELTKLLNSYNLTAMYGGIYDFTSALTKLSSSIPDHRKIAGVVMTFMNNSGFAEVWNFNGNGYQFTDPLGWSQTDSSILLELQQAVFPLSASLTASANIIEVDKTTSVRFDWSISRKGINVTHLATNIFDGNVIGGTNTTLSLSPDGHGSKIYQYTGSYSGMTKSASTTVTYNHRTYYGIVSASTTAVTNLSSLGNNALKSGVGHTWSGISLANQKTVYAYPSYFGNLRDIKDGNGFSNLAGYTKTTVSYNNTEYFVYIKDTATTIENSIQIFS